MKILQVAQKPQRRGAEVFAVQLGEWLRRAGHEVRHLYLYRYDGSKPLTPSPGDRVLDHDPGSPTERLPIGNPRVLGGLRAAVRDLQPDVVQANGGRSVKYSALLAALSPGRSWKLVYRNIDSPVFWVRGLTRKLYFRHAIMPRIDGVVGVSRKTLDEVYDFYGLSRRATPSVFVPNGVDLSALAPDRSRKEIRDELATGPEDVVVLFFGALTAQKRPDRFVRLLAALRDTRAVGWVLGDGEARAETEAAVRAAGLADRVLFLGYRERVAEHLAAADLLASTSDTEGIPAAVLEAGYLGLPTVAFDVGGMAECVRHGETGLLAVEGDEDALAALARRLVEDSAERRCLGEAARRFVAEEFSIESVGSRYEAFYRRLLAS